MLTLFNSQVEDKLRLDLTEEEAVKYLQGLIDLSIRAMFPELMEKIHKFAQVNTFTSNDWLIILFTRTSENNISYQKCQN